MAWQAGARVPWNITNQACVACISANGCEDEASAFFGGNWADQDVLPLSGCAGLMGCLATSECPPVCAASSASGSLLDQCRMNSCYEQCLRAAPPRIRGVDDTFPAAEYLVCADRESAYVGCALTACPAECLPNAPANLAPPADPCWTMFTFKALDPNTVETYDTEVLGPATGTALDERWTQTVTRSGPAELTVTQKWPAREVKTVWQCRPEGLVQTTLPPLGTAVAPPDPTGRRAVTKATLLEGVTLPRWLTRKGQTWRAQYAIETTRTNSRGAPLTTSAQLTLDFTFVGYEVLPRQNGRGNSFAAHIDTKMTTKVLGFSDDRKIVPIPTEPELAIGRSSTWWDMMSGLGTLVAKEGAALANVPFSSTTWLVDTADACTATGAACSDGPACCSDVCKGGACCSNPGGVCRTDGDCCAGRCSGQRCRP